MATLRDKAEALLYIAQTIEDENFFDDVTLEQQRQLETVAAMVKTAGLCLGLHVDAIERHEKTIEAARKLRLVK